MTWLPIATGALAALWWADQAAASTDRSAGGNLTMLQHLTGSKWLADLEGKGAAYKPLLLAAEAEFGIPHLLLCRQAWQESRFDPAARSPAGALGLMQIIPRWHPTMSEADCLTPSRAIPYAAGFLASLKRQFGTWELALKAYNWGPGNVRAWQAGQKSQPLETIRYSRDILADRNAATGGPLA